MISANPLVSLILLSYKQERYIRAAVEAAFAQTYSPLEIIISDDASPDGTFDIIREMAAAYQGPHRVTINRNETNLGIGPHVKKIFATASGEWIVGAAGDDISLPQRCAALVAAAEQAGPSCMGIASGWLDIDDEGNILADSSGASIWHARQMGESWKNGIRGCLNTLRDGTMMLPGCSAMWNRKMFRDWPQFIPGLMFEDVSLSCRAHLCGTLHVIGDVLVHYRKSIGAVTNVSLETDPAKRQEQALRVRRIQRTRLICFDQFLADLDYLEKERGMVFPDRSLVAEIIAHKDLEERRLDWWEWSMIRRIGVLLAGKYPFGSLRPATLIHLLPVAMREKLRSLVNR